MKKTILKILRYLFIFILLAVVVLFAIPVKKQSFSELFTGDKSIEQSLIDFRKTPLKTATYKNINWKYLSIGEGEKHVLFLHGMGGSYDIWWQQIEALKNDFHIVATTMPTVNNLDDAIEGLVTILDNEKINKVSIIGSSMGGYMAQYFLKKYPEKIDKIILGNTFPPNDIYKEKNGGLRNIVPLLPEWVVMSQFKKNVSETVVPESENSKLVEAYLLEQYSGLMTKQQFIGRFDVVLDTFTVKQSTDRKTIPKLIIEADNDPLVMKELREQLKTTYPEAKVFTFKNKGHFPYLNQPEQYNLILKEFLIQD